MNPALVALAIAIVAGGVLAVSSRDIRSVVLGLLVVLAAAPLVADPWPGPVAALARIAAALLAARLVIVGVRDLGETMGSRIGWPAAAVLGAAAGVAGLGSHGLGAAPLGPAAAQAAGFGLIALSLAPLVLARDVFRLGVGAVLLVSGAQLVRVALDRPMTDADQLVAALLVVGLGGAVAVIAAAARAAGGLEAAALDGGGRGPRLPDAHRVEEPPARRRARAPRVGVGTESASPSEPAREPGTAPESGTRSRKSSRSGTRP